MRLLQAAFAAAALSNFCDASNLHPPVIPLVVRNPYLSVWLAGAREVPWDNWPMFWTGGHVGMSVLASTPDNDKVYPLLGRPHDSLLPAHPNDGYNVSLPIYGGVNYDASTTNLTYYIPAPSSVNSTSSLEIVLSFLSPITPTSTLRQSIPASYLSIHIKGDFNVTIYVDLNGQWVSGDRNNHITWDFQQQSFKNGDGLNTFRVQRKEEQMLTEHDDRAEWGTMHFTGPKDARYEVGTSSQLRQRFARTHTLQNQIDKKFRAIMDDEPVFAYSKAFHLNSSHTTSDSVVFTIAHIQDPVVQFAAARGLTFMRPFWASFFKNAQELLTFHYYDFRSATKLASNYSESLFKDAYESGAEDYVDVVALSARQVLGATTFAGTPDNPILFLKEISSNGNFQTVDVIFPSFPFFLYTNPRWLAYLLEPLIEHMLSGQYPNDYSMHDLGSHFPNATGHPDGNDEYMPVEECGNMLIMGLALVNSLVYDTGTAASVFSTPKFHYINTNPKHSAFALTQLQEHEGINYIDDNWGGGTKGLKQAQKWVNRSYKLWKQWTGYLVEFSLEPANQLSTDDFAGWLALQTNLALKGIIGIKAMSGIAAIVNRTEEAKAYEKTARDYVSKWEGFGLSRDKTHAKVAYNWYGSWTTLYNLFADSLLCFRVEDSPSSITPKRSAISIEGDKQKPLKPPKNGTSEFVPAHIYKLQSDWYHYVMQKYGLPLDSRHLYTKSDWQFFAAAVASKSTRKEILDHVATWVDETVTDLPFTDLYDTEGEGGFPGITFKARPVVGGHFAFLALERACGGRATEALRFLDEESDEATLKKVKAAADELMAMKGLNIEL